MVSIVLSLCPRQLWLMIFSSESQLHFNIGFWGLFSIVLKSESTFNLQCENCDCSYDASYNLQLHNKQVNAKQRSSGIHYKCLDCRFRSCTPIGLKQHRFNCEELKANTPKNSQSNQNSQPKKRPKILLPNY